MNLGERAFPVDGFGVSTSTAYQFHGCFWHGHPCVKTAGVVKHPHTGKAMEELYQETLEKDTYVSPGLCRTLLGFASLSLMLPQLP